MYNPDDVIDKYLLDRYDVLSEIAQIGYVGSYQIYIHTNDPGNVPHFHIWDLSTRGEKFHTCIRIDCAKYFHHTGKEDVLNSKLRKELIAFLKSPYRNRGISVWEHLIDTWNDNNSNVILPYDLPMPNYLELE